MDSSLSFIQVTARQYWWIILLSVMLGLALPGISLGICLAILAILVVKRKSEIWQDRWPYKLFVLGVGTRLCIIGLKYILNALTGTGLAIFGDSGMHLSLAKIANYVLAGTIHFSGGIIVPLRYDDYGYSITHWLYGAISLLFGNSNFLLLIINTLSACLAALLIYLIVMRLCSHKPSAALAMGLCLFFPSLLMWSVEMLKEPMIQLCTTLYIYWFIGLTQKSKWYYLLPLAVLCYPFGHLRKYTHFIMFAVLLLSSVLVIPKRVRTSALILLILLLAAAVKLGPSGISAHWQAAQGKIIVSQIGFITTGGSWYKFIPERFTVKNRGPLMSPAEFAISYVKAVGYYLMTPFPFKMPSFNKLPALPQMILWYFLVIFCLVPGSLYLIRYHFRSSMIIFVYLAVLTSAQALFTGNEGTAFRQRDVLTIFYFIPMAVGFFNLKGWLSLHLESMRNKAVPQAAESE